MCAMCEHAARCRGGIVDRYGRAYSGTALECGVCPLAAYCQAANDPTFRSGGHSAPSIIQFANEDMPDAPDPALNPEELAGGVEKTKAEQMTELFTELLDELLLHCDCDPFNVAIVIGRHGGLSYSTIARMLKTSKQLVLYRIKQLKNPALRQYLRSKPSNNAFTSAIRAKVESDPEYMQMELF
jgi:hypothetical protein